MNIVPDRLDPRIRHGHRALLATLRELAGDAAPSATGPVDRDTLAATIAFLRQELIPFARWEEGRIDRDPLKEDTEFEHAFLNAEIDALAALLARPPGEADAEVRRRLHRIAAVLELHVLKAEDRDGVAGEPAPVPEPAVASSDSPDAPPPSRATGPRSMSSGEADAFVGAHNWGVLAVLDGERPYAVPVAYGLDAGRVYLATGPGLKLDALRASPAVCLTVMDVVDGNHYRSVVLRGRAEVVSDVRGRLHGLNVLRRQRDEPFSARNLARAASAILFRITPDEVTGRVAG